jgi:hypothetical protein
MRTGVVGLVSAVLILAALAICASAAATDEEIKQLIINESLASYPGNCPCPYNRAANGSICGKRSAWSKPGGYNPICYPEEVTPQMIEAWRDQHNE